MINIIFLGFGNVNHHLCNTLHKIDEVSVIQVYNRSAIVPSSELKDISFTTEISEIKDADIYIVGIPDDAIRSFSERLPFRNKLLVHTSGGVTMKSLSSKNRRGVFYPLQTFSKNREVSFTEIPICIEAEEASNEALLKTLAGYISKNVVVISSEERAKLHVAAVFVNNFVNYLYSVSEEIVTKESLDFNLLKPLIAETAAKITELSPSEVQTGPAKRNDIKTIEKHLHLLDDGPYKMLYKQLTKAIQEKYTHGKKL